MDKTKTIKQNGIISLVVVMSVGLFALAAAFAVTALVAGDLIKNKNMVSGDQAFYTAESGLGEGTYQCLENIKNGIDCSGGAIPFSINNASGGIEVTSSWPYIFVTSTAQNTRNNRKVIYTITRFPEGLAFDHAVYAQEFLTTGGNAEVNGSIFANQGIDFTGNSADINGNAYSASSITDTDNINGGVFEHVTPVPMPDFNFDPYYQEALANDTYFGTSTDAASYLKNRTRNAVVFVEDDDETKIQETDLTGSLVVTGDLSLTGGTYTAAEKHLAIVVYGDLKVAGGTAINGVVYVKGQASFGAGNNTINGALLCGGQTYITGSIIINYDPELSQAWRDMSGLNTTTEQSPRIILWKEE